MLNVPVEEAESIAARMIMAGQITGSIDQIEGYVEFSEEKEGETLIQWDSVINEVCHSVTNTVDIISKKYPDVIKRVEAS